MVIRRGRGSRGRGNQLDSSRRVATRSRSQTINPNQVPTVINNDKCGICSLPVGNDGIGCYRCSTWYHPTPQCTGLRAGTIKCIQEEGGDSVRYVCNGCRCKPASDQANASDLSPDFLQSSISQLFEMVKSIAQSVALLTNKFNSSSDVVRDNVPNQSITPGFITTRESLFTEFEERKKRKESMIVRGIIASNEDEFRTIFGRVTTAIIGSNCQPDNVVSVNQQANMFRIKLSDGEARKNILLNAKQLKNTANYRNIYISRDLTYLQRKEMRDRRAASGYASGSNATRIGGDSSSIPSVSVGVASNISIPSDDHLSGTPGMAPEVGPSDEDPQSNF